MDKFIKALKCFTKFTEKEIRSVLLKCNQVYVKKGESILTEGEVCDKVWFVVSGCMMLASNNKQKGKIIELYSEENFFTEIISFTNNTPANYSLEAIIDTELLCISKADFNELSNYCASWRLFSIKLLETFCRSMTLEIVSLKTRSNQERYKELLEKRPFLIQLIPQYIIANYLDMTPVGLSKLRGRLTGQNHKTAYRPYLYYPVSPLRTTS